MSKADYNMIRLHCLYITKEAVILNYTPVLDKFMVSGDPNSLSDVNE